MLNRCISVLLNKMAAELREQDSYLFTRAITAGGCHSSQLQ